MSKASEGRIVVLSGPSGVGKTTISERLRAEFPLFCYSVSATTRAPRTGEVNGRDYFFLSREEFEKGIREGAFAEYAEVFDNLYGTPKKGLLEAMAKGRVPLLDVDVQGAELLRANGFGGVYVFILPPSIEDLRKRLDRRGTKRHELDRRVAEAGREMEAASRYDYRVVNDDLDRTYREIREILKKEIPGLEAREQSA